MNNKNYLELERKIENGKFKVKVKKLKRNEYELQVEKCKFIITDVNIYIIIGENKILFDKQKYPLLYKVIIKNLFNEILKYIYYRIKGKELTIEVVSGQIVAINYQ